MRRRAEKLRDLWSVDVQFRPLEEEDGETSIGDNDDWQVTFVDQVIIKWHFLICFMKRRISFMDAERANDRGVLRSTKNS